MIAFTYNCLVCRRRMVSDEDDCLTFVLDVPNRRQRVACCRLCFWRTFYGVRMGSPEADVLIDTTDKGEAKALELYKEGNGIPDDFFWRTLHESRG